MGGVEGRGDGRVREKGGMFDKIGARTHGTRGVTGKNV